MILSRSAKNGAGRNGSSVFWISGGHGEVLGRELPFSLEVVLWFFCEMRHGVTAIAIGMLLVDRENGVLLESGVVMAEVGGVWNRFDPGNSAEYKFMGNV